MTGPAVRATPGWPAADDGMRGGPTVIRALADEEPVSLVARMGLRTQEPRPVIVVCGGADELTGDASAVARAVLGPAVATAARATAACVVDGGTAAGVMAIVGRQRAHDPDALPTLVGVAPAGRVAPEGESPGDRPALERHHTHVLLADSDEWGGETELLLGMAQELASGAPVVMVLAGGGDIAWQEAAGAVRRGWPLFVIEGTGKAADTIAAARRGGAEGDPTQPVELEVILAGDVRIVSGAGAAGFARRLAWELTDEPSLKDAWAMFATYDGHAADRRKAFERIQATILLLGLLATLLALINETVPSAVLHWTVVAVPIIASTLIALANRRSAGKRWVLLRGAAEAIKTEIYRYRTRIAPYAGDGDDRRERARRLTDQLTAIEGLLVQSDASNGPLTPYSGPLPPDMYGAAATDDGVSALDARRYIEIRLADQLRYYQARIPALDKRRGILQVAMVSAGGAGAILAAAGLEIWIGLTTAIAAAALSQLWYLQIDNTIVAYNQSAAGLAALQREFNSDPAAFDVPEAREDLVMRGESVLVTEQGSWVQQMSDAIQQQRERQGREEERTAAGPADRSTVQRNSVA